MKRGFTMIELMMAVMILSVMMVITFFTFNTVVRNWQKSMELVDKIQYADYALTQVVSGLRSAYYPTDGKQSEDFGFQLYDNGDKEDASGEVIEPNSVLILSQPESQACSVEYMGEVPMCATSIELFTIDDGSGAQNQDIYLASPSVADFALSELTGVLVESGAFAASTGVSSNPLDILYVYENKTSGHNIAPDNAYYYRNRGTVKRWLDSNKSAADSNIIPAGSAIVIRKLANSEEFAARVKFVPSYISNQD